MGHHVDLTPDEKLDGIEAMAILDDFKTGRGDLPREHVDHELVPEAILAECKDLLKLLQCVLEAMLDQLRLHPRRQHLVEIKLFYNHIMIPAERHREASVHLICELCRKLFGLVLVLNLKDGPFVGLF